MTPVHGQGSFRPYSGEIDAKSPGTPRRPPGNIGGRVGVWGNGISTLPRPHLPFVQSSGASERGRFPACARGGCACVGRVLVPSVFLHLACHAPPLRVLSSTTYSCGAALSARTAWTLSVASYLAISYGVFLRAGGCLPRGRGEAGEIIGRGWGANPRF